MKIKNQKEKFNKIFKLIDSVLVENEATLGEALLVFGELSKFYQRKASNEFKIK